jgi:hypothetical protein
MDISIRAAVAEARLALQGGGIQIDSVTVENNPSRPVVDDAVGPPAATSAPSVSQR